MSDYPRQKNRRFSRFYKLENVLRPVLTQWKLTTPSRSRFKCKSPIALPCGPTDPHQTARQPDKIYAQPVRRHTVAILWVESGKQLVKINAKNLRHS
jgi:hypothetical protein